MTSKTKAGFKEYIVHLESTVIFILICNQYHICIPIPTGEDMRFIKLNKARTSILLLFFIVFAMIYLRYDPHYGDKYRIDDIAGDVRLRGLSYETVVDLFGTPTKEGIRTLSWEDEPDPSFGRMQTSFALMTPGDTIQIMTLWWKEDDGWQRVIHLYCQNGVWWVFHSFEWPPDAIIEGMVGWETMKM